MSKYINIGDLPAVKSGSSKWNGRFEEWMRIPPGKALELETEKGEDLHTFSVGAKAVLKRKQGHHLRVQQVQKRLYIINEAKL